MPETLQLTLTGLVAAHAIVAVAGLVHGTLGLGFPLVATPLLALLVDVRSAILITLLPTVTVNLVSILRGGNWGQSIGRFWPFSIYAVAGSALGARILVEADPAPFKLLLAGLVLLYLVASRMRRLDMPWVAGAWVAAHHHVSMLVFGLVAGMSAGTTNVMVPILIIYALELGLPRTAMVQVFNLSFLAGKVAQMLVFGAAGLFGVAFAWATAPLAATALAALAAGMWLRERIPVTTYQRLVRALLAILAGMLVVQYFMSG